MTATWSTADLELPEEPTPPRPQPRPRRRVLRLGILVALLAAAPAAAGVLDSSRGTTATPPPAATPAGPAAPVVPVVPDDPVPETPVAAAPEAPPAPQPVGADLAAGTVTYAYGPDPTQVLDLHTAGPTTGPRPLLVYLHSGGWTSGSRTNVPDLVRAQVARGWAVAAVDFALAPAAPFPAANADIDRALRWLDAHGAALGLADGPPVLLGTSSGGHLALVAAAAPGRHTAAGLPPELVAASPHVAAVVAVAATTDLADLLAQTEGWGPAAVAAYLGCTGPCDPAVVASATPAQQVDPGPPPALLLHGEFDTLAPADVSGERLRRAWAEAGGTATVVEAIGFGHNLGLGAGVDLAALNAFLDAADDG